MLHAFIGGSVERFRIGLANDSLCAIGGSVNRTINSARLPNRQDWGIGQNIAFLQGWFCALISLGATLFFTSWYQFSRDLARLLHSRRTLSLAKDKNSG